MSAAPERPSWWSAADEAILAGEMDRLAELRPAAVERKIDSLEYVPIAVPKRNRTRRLGLWIIAVAVIALFLLVMSWAGERPAPSPCAGDPAGCADFTTMPAFPATYGPPGPNGGPA